MGRRPKGIDTKYIGGDTLNLNLQSDPAEAQALTTQPVMGANLSVPSMPMPIIMQPEPKKGLDWTEAVMAIAGWLSFLGVLGFSIAIVMRIVRLFG